MSYCIVEQGKKQGDISAVLPQVKELFTKFTHKKSLEVDDEFLQLATSKKSPIGYEIFYQSMMDKGHKEAFKYIDMIPNLSLERSCQMIQACQQEQPN